MRFASCLPGGPVPVPCLPLLEPVGAAQSLPRGVECGVPGGDMRERLKT